MQALMPNIQLLHIEMYSYILWRLKGRRLRDSAVAAHVLQKISSRIFIFLHLN